MPTTSLARLIPVAVLLACTSAPTNTDEGVVGDLFVLSDVLTELPDIVHLKTNTLSYNSRYYYGVLDGELWIKPNVERTSSDGPWERVPLTPELEGRVSMVSVDDHGLVVFDTDQRLTWSMNEALNVPMIPKWTTSWGAPLATGPGMSLPGPLLKWEWAVLTRAADEYFVDPAGNHQLVGLGTVAHIFALNSDGQRITYMDPILPVDTSYEMCGPHRGRLQMVNLSTSGSTTFVMNRYGDMYTRLYDFDISGADTLFFRYTYESMPGVSGAPIQLPAPDWIMHPRIDGQITDRITIFKTGIGSDSRILRVEGLNAEGDVGYYEKPITGMRTSDWEFHATQEPLHGKLLDNAGLADRSMETIGAGEDRRYALHGDGWDAALLDFNLYCSPAALRIELDDGEVLDLVLHHADAIRQTERVGRFTEEPRELNGAIEVPETLWERRDQLGAAATAFLSMHLSTTSRFTTVPLTAALSTVSVNRWTMSFEAP